jgi:hypothetical protein
MTPPPETLWVPGWCSTVISASRLGLPQRRAQHVA